MKIPFSVRHIGPEDAGSWLRLRRTLWQESHENEHAEEIRAYFAGTLAEPQAVLVAEDAAGEIVGFVELSIRGYAEGCTTDRIGYLEGWYVVPEARRRGVGRALVTASEQWARLQGCTEFASDTELDNDVSAAAHAALGFTETARIRCFRKEL